MIIRDLKKITGFLILAMLLFFPVLSPAADFPSRPISLVVPYAAGGATDMVARALEKVSGKYLPVPLVVVNHVGGAGIMGRQAVVSSRPDGYTLLFGYGSGEDLVTPHTTKLTYDPFKDLLPVCQITIASLVIVVPASNPARTLKEFIDWARTQKNVTGAVSTRGASVDITMQALMKVAGVDQAVTVPFRGGAEAITAVVGGHTVFAGGVPA